MSGKRRPEDILRDFEQIFGAGGFGHGDFWQQFRGVKGDQGPPIWDEFPQGAAHHRSQPGAEPNEAPVRPYEKQGTQVLQSRNPHTGAWEQVPCDFNRK